MGLFVCLFVCLFILFIYLFIYFGGTGVKELMIGLATVPQGNQEPLVAKVTVARPR